MPEYTTSFNLEKPLQNEYFDIDIQNGNMDIVDSELKKTNIQIDELASNGVGKGASKIGIHDVDGNFIATDVEGALSELFTNVSNGKQQIATAITDVDNSLNPSGSDTFTGLANTIKSISTGKKFASGYVNSTNIIEIHSLDFRPSKIAIIGYNATIASYCFNGFYDSARGINGYMKYANGYIKYSTDSAFYMNPTFYSDGFKVASSSIADKIYWYAFE